MKCLRCGHCCTEYMVVIVDDPDKVTSSEDFNASNLKLKEGGKRCQHLRGDKIGEYSCSIHNYPWYKETPCYTHSQIEQKNSDCRIGKWFLDNYNKENAKDERE